MDFSDRTFQEFVVEAVSLDIDSEKYHYASNSKANRLRQFIKVESNYTFGKLLSAFCDYWLSKVYMGDIDYLAEENIYKECTRIADRLKQDSIVEHIDAIQPNVEDKDFKLLAKSIRESVEKNEPEAGLDRLHTFTFRYLRELCDKHQIEYDKSNSLNSVFGKYIKFIVDNKHIESTMAEKILKYSINLIEAFNDIRNNKSFAHDNSVLNYQESVLIFNNVSNTIKFIESIEARMKKVIEYEQNKNSDLPF
ncbi:abortive infection family protein [Mariniflexile gromovii]|uniref:Abortive infection family protein n=1 Tax=Mariniflexile gromovii TaxID=362523 RepID=A0ABS4BYN4_9FLAO|nr:abortive infection family protein [Mariniflexile gromovii]MBP0905692.1 abortive infection family protein [Mariniflexile gromovii]